MHQYRHLGAIAIISIKNPDKMDDIKNLYSFVISTKAKSKILHSALKQNQIFL